MRRARFAVLFLPLVCAAGLTNLACAAFPQQAASDAIEDFDKQLGPFAIGGQQFTIVVHKKRIAGSPDSDFGETMVGLQIKDAADKVHYEEKSQGIPAVSNTGGFDETTDVSVSLLQGKQRSGLLVVHSSLPSTPLGGASWQVFGLFDKNLVPFSKPLYLEGDLVHDESANQVIHTDSEPNLQGEVLNFRIWSGNFFVIFPARVDWLQAKMTPAWRCGTMTARGIQPLCRYRMQADRIPAEEDPTFVRLFPEPEDGFTPAHIVVRKDSQVEFLEVVRGSLGRG